MSAQPTPGSNQNILTFLGTVTCTPLVKTPCSVISASQAPMTVPSASLLKMWKMVSGTVENTICVISDVTQDLSPSHLTMDQTIALKVSGFFPQSQHSVLLVMRKQQQQLQTQQPWNHLCLYCYLPTFCSDPAASKNKNEFMLL